MQNTNNKAKVVLFSTNKLTSGLFEGSSVIPHERAKETLGSYLVQPVDNIDFQDPEALRERLSKVVPEDVDIDVLLSSLTNPTSSGETKEAIQKILKDESNGGPVPTKDIYTVGEYVYAVECLNQVSDSNGKWIETLCKCIAIILQEEKAKLGSLFLFLHASDIEGEGEMGELYKEVTAEYKSSIKESKLTPAKHVRVFLFHHVDGPINDILENKKEASGIYGALLDLLGDDRSALNEIDEKERKIIVYEDDTDAGGV